MPETFRQKTQRILNSMLAPAGLSMSRRDRFFDMDGMLARAVRRGVSPATVIDIGASDGVWSVLCRRHFPRSRYLLFEPLAEHEEALARLRGRYGFETITAVAGPATGTVRFAVESGLDGSAITDGEGPAVRTVAQESVDAAVSARGFPGPFLLKLDTHGYEEQVLAGAGDVLAETTLLVIEAYNFRLTSRSLRFHELCAKLETLGFRCCDIADPMRRPGDGAFWQIDLAFAPAADPMFQSNQYRPMD